MSKFRTIVPIEVKATLKKLPTGATVHSVILTPDHSAVEIVWEHERFKTLHTYPVDCPDPENPPVHKQGVSGQQTSSLSPKPSARADAPPVPTKSVKRGSRL
jgi:hypothetical protein